jgi:hypothetical protein
MRQLKLALALMAPSAVLCTMSASAQTRFQWPDTSEHVAHYANMEDCLAAADRVRSSVNRREELTEWHDTMPRDPREALKPQRAQVTQTASQCAAQFAEAKVDVHDFAPAMKLFLAAGRDSDAAALVERRIAAAPPKSARERGAVVDSAVEFYVHAKPSRLDAAEGLLLHRARTTTDRVERMRTYHSMFQASRDAGDTARTIRIARMLMKVADSLTVADRKSDEFEQPINGNSGPLIIYDALEELTGLKARTDSLLKSTAAYAALERGNWSKATGERPEAFQIPVGQHAATLSADFWFPSTAGSSPHPTRGRIALVLFLEHTQCISSPAGDDAAPSSVCATRMAVLRRLAHRFPSIEIDIVMSTHGQFMYLPPTAPAEEAALIKQMVDSYQVPEAVLGVTSTPFWRLPDPDSRRVEKILPNVAHYDFGFGKIWGVGSGSMFLVDPDGLIVDTLRLRENELGHFIEVLIQRQNKGN